MSKTLKNSPSPSDRFDLATSLKQIGVSVNDMSDTHWSIELEHERATYSASIKHLGKWLSYAAELIPDVEGRKKEELYESLLSLNACLNGAYVAKQGPQIILVRNEFTEDINAETLLRGLAVFHRTHEYLINILTTKKD